MFIYFFSFFQFYYQFYMEKISFFSKLCIIAPGHPISKTKIYTHVVEFLILLDDNFQLKGFLGKEYN